MTKNITFTNKTYLENLAMRIRSCGANFSINGLVISVEVTQEQWDWLNITTNMNEVVSIT